MLVSKVVVSQVVDLEVGLPVRLVIDAQTTLLLDSVALIIQIGLIDRQRAHPVGFEEKHEIELVLGQDLIVVGEVLVRRAIHPAAVVQNQQEVLALADILRALEHHVLEEVREACAAGAFVARTHVVSDRDGDDRRTMFRGDDYA
jgi:hypothetical protein